MIVQDFQPCRNPARKCWSLQGEISRYPVCFASGQFILSGAGFRRPSSLPGAEKGTGFVKRHVIGGQGDSRLRGTEGMFYAHQVKQEFKRQVVGENAVRIGTQCFFQSGTFFPQGFREIEKHRNLCDLLFIGVRTMPDSGFSE